jgi:hypothetical protein
MKNALLLLILFFAKQMQAQNYIPMNLDTSCFWVNDASFYNGFSGSPVYCNYESTSYVEKDTIINGLHYFKIISYLSTHLSANPSWAINECNFIDKTNRVSFMREDTILKKKLYIRLLSF